VGSDDPSGPQKEGHEADALKGESPARGGGIFPAWFVAERALTLEVPNLSKREGGLGGARKRPKPRPFRPGLHADRIPRRMLW